MRSSYPAPLARRRDLPEVRDNGEGVSPAPPLPLSHSVRPYTTNNSSQHRFRKENKR